MKLKGMARLPLAAIVVLLAWGAAVSIAGRCGLDTFFFDTGDKMNWTNGYNHC
jgi:hypothetical protein